DSGLVARIAPGERRTAALDVIAALQSMQAPGAATRFAEALELLSALQADLSPGEVSALAAVTSAYVASETEGPVKVIRAAAAADLEFPPAFYVELFVLASTVPPDAQSGRRAPLPAELLAKLPEEQRRYLGDTAVAALAAGMEPTEL